MNSHLSESSRLRACAASYYFTNKETNDKLIRRLIISKKKLRETRDNK